MKEIEKRRWYYNHGKSYEVFSVLYDDGKYIIVRNDETGKYSFGLERDFGTLFGFGVDTSCIKKSDVIRILKGYIKIDKQYIKSLGQYALDNISRWESMISAVGDAS